MNSLGVMAKKLKSQSVLPVERLDLLQSHRVLHDTIRDLWTNYIDPAGNKPSSPNSHMTLRKHWNRHFGISSIKELSGDAERCLLYALGLVRSAKAIREGIEQKLLRSEIRQKTYQIFETVGKL